MDASITTLPALARQTLARSQCHPPIVSSVIIGARNEEQLKQNLGAVGWELTPAYPYWHQRGFKERNPSPM
jgi:aryl-alcohol dehydrogenase-like predicted oxidoreductase